EGKVCTIPEGFIAAALFAVTGETYQVVEDSCMNEEKQYCRFIISKNSKNIIKPLLLNSVEMQSLDDLDADSNINKQAIVDAVVTLPIFGNEDGLIPMFNVYLANTPQTFYNLVCSRYLEEMTKVDRGTVAKLSLMRDAEFCAMNTFSGILNSDEWQALIKPMVKVQSDNVFGLIAVANALGWGRIFIREHIQGLILNLRVLNGYESFGYLELNTGAAKEAKCFMMAGISSGVMALIYQKGNFDERLGSFHTNETSCMCREDHHCEFQTIKNK
ncbi:MAG: hypothetical protein Q7U04_03415, partial [Bacteriovorax sp.]|nr:hypothetical protein [Bacteriovorax sp.]